MKSINDFKRVRELCIQHGFNYVKVAEDMPHLSPFTIDRYVRWAKTGTSASSPIL